MKRYVVEKASLEHNVRLILEKAGDKVVWGVIKGNGYGLGVVPMSRLLAAYGIRHFAVTDIHEVRALREDGCEDPILMLSGTCDPAEVNELLDLNAILTVSSVEDAKVLDEQARLRATVAEAHVKIDTGMGRYGFLPTETDRILSVFRYLGNLHVTGTYTHYANAFRSVKKTQEQLDIFRAVVDKIRAAGYDPGMLHASNSEAMFGCKLPNLDAVRIGSALGGRVISKGDHGLQRTGRLQSQISEIRWLPKGAEVGYGSAYVTKQPTRVAIVPVGSSDGYMVEKIRTSHSFKACFRAACSAMLGFFRRRRYYVLVDGKRAPVIGHVGVNHTAIDVTNIPCAPGDTVLMDAAPLFVPDSIPRQYVD